MDAMKPNSNPPEEPSLPSRRSAYITTGTPEAPVFMPADPSNCEDVAAAQRAFEAEKNRQHDLYDSEVRKSLAYEAGGRGGTIHFDDEKSPEAIAYRDTVRKANIEKPGSVTGMVSMSGGVDWKWLRPKPEWAMTPQERLDKAAAAVAAYATESRTIDATVPVPADAPDLKDSHVLDAEQYFTLPKGSLTREELDALNRIRNKIPPLTQEQAERRANLDTDRFWSWRPETDFMQDTVLPIPDPPRPTLTYSDNYLRQVGAVCAANGFTPPAEVVNIIPGGTTPLMVQRGKTIADTLENVYSIKENSGYYAELAQQNERRGILIRRLSFALFVTAVLGIGLSLTLLIRTW